MGVSVIPVGAIAEALISTRSGCISFDELAGRLFLRKRLVEEAVKRLAEAAESDVLELREDCVVVRDVLGLALAAVRLGVSENVVARGLDWRMFEEYAARALAEAGYRVYRGLRVGGRGGLELDVLGLGARVGVAIDCKHWEPRYTVPSRLREAAKRHVERVMKLASFWDRLRLPPGCWKIIPALLVLREHVPRLLEGVVIVPVSRLRGFIEEISVLAEADEVASRPICSRQKKLF